MHKYQKLKEILKIGHKVDVYITPPENGNKTEDDSGDEELVCLSSLAGKVTFQRKKFTQKT